MSANRGWVVGDRRILATTDGGAHWSEQYSGKESLGSVDFVDTTHGWAIGSEHLLRTEDGGRNWQYLPPACDKVHAVHFVSPTVGFGLAGGAGGYGYGGPTQPADRMLVVTTTDGGEHWSHLPSPVDPQSICLTTERSGWLGTGDGIYRTTDGARTWVSSLSSPGLGTTWAVSLQCAGPGAAWAMFSDNEGGSGGAELHEAYHGDGTRWESLGGVVGAYPGVFSSISGTAAAFFGSSMNLDPGSSVPAAITADSGRTFDQPGPVPGLWDATSTAFVSTSLGWVVGYAPLHDGAAESWRILRTRDGARTWQVQWREDVTQKG